MLLMRPELMSERKACESKQLLLGKLFAIKTDLILMGQRSHSPLIGSQSTALQSVSLN